MKRIIGDIIIVIIGIFPFLDNLLIKFDLIDFEFGNNFGFDNGYNFLYTFLSAITPILFTIAFRLKPHLLFFTLPVFSYSSDLFWIFGNHNRSLDFSYLYGAFATIAFIVISILLNKYLKEEQSKEEKITFLEKMLDLSYAIAKKRNEK